MKHKKRLRALAVYIILGCFFFNTFVSYANEVLTTSSFKAADNITLTQQTVLDVKGNIQKTYFAELENDGSGFFDFLFGSSLNSRTSLDKLIEINKGNIDNPLGNEEVIDDAQQNNSKAVAAMNCDFFNMSNGIPESAVIKNGRIISSDRDNNVFAVRDDGTVFFDKPQIKISVEFEDKNYKVLHFNKEFSEYGLYLYTSDFAQATKINVPTVELVLMPYCSKLEISQLIDLYFDGESLPDDLYITVESNENGEFSEVQSEESVAEIEAEADIETDTEIEVETEVKAEVDTVDETDDEIGEEFVEEDNNEASDQYDDDILSELFIDREQDGSDIESEYSEKNLVLNPEYTQELDNFAFSLEYIKVGECYYKQEELFTKIGASENAVVIEKRDNVDGKSLEMKDGFYYLCANSKTQGFKLEKTDVGTEVKISVDANESFYNVTDAIGCGALIVQDGKAVKHTELSHYFSYQPRTAIGIKNDGSIVMYSVDGRQPDFSTGLTLSQLSEEMIRLGCVYAANLDGGGSTTVKMMSLDDGVLKTANKPSEGTERKVSNAIAFYNPEKGNGKAEHSYFTDSCYFVMPNSFVTFENIRYTDSAHNVIEHDLSENSFTYFDEYRTEIIDDFVYSPYGNTGKIEIYSFSEDGNVNPAFVLTSVTDVDKIELSADTDTVYVGDSVDFDAASEICGFDVADNDKEYFWYTDVNAGFIDENGVFYGTQACEKASVTASFGTAYGTAFITVLDLPFLDISEHWSKKNICTVYELGVALGELTPDGRMYYPDRNFTRNEFCVMLSRLLGLTVAVDTKPEAPQQVNSSENDEIKAEDNSENVEETDVEAEVEAEELSDDLSAESDELIPEEEYTFTKSTYADFEQIPSWCIDSVEALLSKGMLYGFEHKNGQESVFDGSAPVTRREVMRTIGAILPTAPVDFEIQLVDVTEDDEDYQFIKNTIYAGVFKGYLDNTIKPDNLLTRAEVAAVFVRLDEYNSASF